MIEEATAPKLDTDATQQSASSEEVSREPHLEPGGETDSQNATAKGEITSQATAVTSAQPSVASCTFCRIIAKQLPSKIIYEDSDYICFIDRSPVSTHHYLIAPRQHIRDARSLTKEQLPVIEKMAEIGKQVLAERGGELGDVRMGFHWPPFLMVRHLHMHVISPASQMGWLHRNIVFRNDSFAFTSPTATIDYLKKSLNK